MKTKLGSTRRKRKKREKKTEREIIKKREREVKRNTDFNTGRITFGISASTNPYVESIMIWSDGYRDSVPRFCADHLYNICKRCSSRSTA